MKHVTAFVYRIKDTFYNPSFYQRSASEPRDKAISMLLWVNVIAATVFAGSILVSVIPAMIDFSKNSYVADVYPDDLIVEIKNGEASVNQEVPYFVPAQGEFENDTANFLVIDTTEELSMETIKSYDSLAVLTKDSIYFAKDENEMRIFDLDKEHDLTINETNVVSWMKIAEKWAYIAILPVTLIIMGFVVGFSFVYYFVLAFAFALLPLIIGKIRKHEITYKSAFTIALYAFVPVTMVDVILMLFGVMVIPFWVVLVVFTVVVLINLWNWPGVAKSSDASDSAEPL